MKKIKTTGKIINKIQTVAAAITILFAFGTVAHANLSASLSSVSFGSQTVTATSAAAMSTVNNASGACVTSSGTWANYPLAQTATGSFRVTFDATPSAAMIDGVTGLSFGPASAYTNLAAIVRFNNTGVIDAMNSTAYTAIAKIPYSGGTAYHFILDVNTTTHTYSAYVMIGSVQTTIGSNLAFRAPQATTSSLNNVGAMSTIASHSVCNVVLSQSTVVGVGPSITSQPSSRSVTAGQTTTFTVAATGTAPMTYQWKKNSVAIAGATSSSYTTPAETATDNSAQFTVSVSNSAGSATSNAAILTVTSAPLAPAITSQPVSQTVTAGQTATFHVAASGTAPIMYQWMKNGTALSGATLSYYNAPPTTVADSASKFSVIVKNSAGSATSAAATLTVIPASQACVTSSEAWANEPLALTATGSFRVTFDATPSAAMIDGVTGLSFGPASAYTNLAAIVRFNNTGVIDAMNSTAYTAIAKIPYSGGTAYHFILDVNTTTHTYSAYVMIGSVQTTIGSNLAFRAPQATTSSLNNVGAMSTIASHSVCNVVLSQSTVVGVGPSITSQPSSRSVTAGQTTTFTVAATGTAPMTYQWKKNSVAIAGATSSSYTTPAETATDNSAQFTVSVSNSAGSATSNAAVLTVTSVTVAPAITTQPASQTVLAGRTATFAVGASGTAPLTYQWKKNGVAIGGATSSTYTTPAETTTDNNAQFTVAVGNTAGSATSNAAVLTVSASTLLLNSSSSTLSFGSVGVSSSSTLNATLTNAGNSSITISTVTISGAGFNASGVSSGLIMAPGQSATLTATFAPSGAGSSTGKVTVASNATNSPDSISLSGTGVAAVVHSVGLSWSPSTSAVVGYNTYASAQSGGPYTKLTSTPVAATSYTDSTVQAGQTYYFVITSVDSTNQESAYSSEVSALVP